MPVLDVPLLLAASAGITVTLFVLGLFGRNRRSPAAAVHRRMEQLATADEVSPTGASFAERAMWPVLSVVLRRARRVLPSRIVSGLNETLEMAGRPMTPNRFLVICFLTGVCAPVATALVVVVSTRHFGAGPLIVLLFGIAAGHYLPWTWLRRHAQERVKETDRNLPDAIDLIITNIEAGLGMQAALLMVSQKYAGPVGEAFGRVVRDVSVGADRREALLAMAQRSGVPGMKLFARAVAQAEQTGIPVARVLRNHAAEIREKRQQRAREQAAKIPVKITIPTVLVMFPTLFLLILGPVALDVMERFR